MSVAIPETTRVRENTFGMPVGWFGKLPSHGDFLQRRVPEGFLRTWDSWLQACIAGSSDRLADAWLSTYLTSPVWRFFLGRGVIGASTFAGIMLPSVDRVGRYFPLTVLAELPADLPVMAVAIHGREWLTKVESLALGALQSDVDVEEFDLALRASGESLMQVERHYGIELNEDFPGAGRHWRMPMVSVDRVAAALIDPLMCVAGRSLQPMSLWWTDGSEQMSAACLLVQGLPAPPQYIAMLDGQWESHGWRGEFGDFVRAPRGTFNYSIACAAITDTGVVRATNQDRYLSRADAGLWVVADGMGGHQAGEYASQLVVDVIASLEPAANIGASLESARIGLERVNDDLVRASMNSGDGARSGSTVVLLSIRQLEWGVLWAGDSRAYLLRDGVVKALTRDHSTGADDDFDANMPPPSTGEITRAAGGSEELVLDRTTGQLRAGDRFLLCSDGLHGVVAHQRLSDLLKANTDADATVHELLAAAIEAGSRDNITAVIVDVVAEQ